MINLGYEVARIKFEDRSGGGSSYKVNKDNLDLILFIIEQGEKNE